jgi:hypothetical protein
VLALLWVSPLVGVGVGVVLGIGAGVLNVTFGSGLPSVFTSFLTFPIGSGPMYLLQKHLYIEKYIEQQPENCKREDPGSDLAVSTKAHAVGEPLGLMPMRAEKG